VTIKNFTVIMENEYTETFGIVLYSASNNQIINNTIIGFWSIQALNAIAYGGIHVKGGDSNQITQNNLVNNLDGMRFINSSYNFITENNITSRVEASPFTSLIFFGGSGGSSNNFVYHNNFVNTTLQAQTDSNSFNFWDDGRFGNYWSDYKTKYPNAQQSGNTGTVNTAYVIDDNNQDNHPLLKPFNITLYTILTTHPKIKVITPINQRYNESTVPLTIQTDQVNWIGYSIDDQANVTVSGNQTLQDIPNGEHTLAIYANNSYGNMQKEIVNFTVTKQPLETPVPPILIVATVLVVCAAAIVGGLAVYVNKRRR
jgi:parallel beta-helix repeat protein